LWAPDPEMRVAVHQPVFLPWPGFFYKAIRADCLVLLDTVQFPRGFTWLTRNRIKGPDGEVWLRVPVLRKGRGLQRIDEVRCLPESRWRKKHLETFVHCYGKAPFFQETFSDLERIYEIPQNRLLDVNLPIIDLLWHGLGVERPYRLLSSLGVTGQGTALMASICESLGADRLVAFRLARPHLDERLLSDRGITVEWFPLPSPVYPQLWGDFARDLSAIDILFLYGPYARRILDRAK